MYWDIGGELGYQREEEYLTLAHLSLSRNDIEKALDVLAWLEHIAQRTSLVGLGIQTGALRALALQAREDETGALRVLETARRQAALEGYVRTFLDLGEPMHRLLLRDRCFLMR